MQSQCQVLSEPLLLRGADWAGKGTNLSNDSVELVALQSAVQCFFSEPCHPALFSCS